MTPPCRRVGASNEGIGLVGRARTVHAVIFCFTPYRLTR
jgi:hypothetical protein